MDLDEQPVGAGGDRGTCSRRGLRFRILQAVAAEWEWPAAPGFQGRWCGRAGRSRRALPGDIERKKNAREKKEGFQSQCTESGWEVNQDMGFISVFVSVRGPDSAEMGL